jgi:hypothetical protein
MLGCSWCTRDICSLVVVSTCHKRLSAVHHCCTVCPCCCCTLILKHWRAPLCAQVCKLAAKLTAAVPYEILLRPVHRLHAPAELDALQYTHLLLSLVQVPLTFVVALSVLPLVCSWKVPVRETGVANAVHPCTLVVHSA